MNITVNTSLNVIAKSVDTIADISREFTDGTRLHEVEEVKDKLSHSIGTKFGPASCWKYNVVRNAGENEPTATFDITIEDDAILMYLPMAVKIAKALSPLYDMAKSAIKLMRNLQGQINSICNGYNKKFQRTFGKPKKYAIASLWNSDLELFDVAVVEDDGFDNQRLVYAEHCGKIYKADVIMKIFEAAQERGEKSKDSMTRRYPLAEFEEITREEAEKKAREFRKSLQEDVDNWYDNIMAGAIDR